jgi:hypothetical protein
MTRELKLFAAQLHQDDEIGQWKPPETRGCSTTQW